MPFFFQLFAGYFQTSQTRKQEMRGKCQGALKPIFLSSPCPSCPSCPACRSPLPPRIPVCVCIRRWIANHTLSCSSREPGACAYRSSMKTTRTHNRPAPLTRSVRAESKRGAPCRCRLDSRKGSMLNFRVPLVSPFPFITGSIQVSVVVCC